MSFEPETAVCPKCKRQGCWSGEEATDREVIDGAPIKFMDWTCKCGHIISEEVPYTATSQTGFVGGMGRP